MKIIACYSNKGGVGKTATSVNLAHALARDGQRVLLCDLDPQGAAGFYLRVKPSKNLKDDRFFKDVQRFTDAIRGSDHDRLDVLPANLSFRDFDVFLARMKNSRSRLKKALRAGGGDYDSVVLDCPPNISTLGESVFRAADAIVVPVIPTTLSERTFGQLLDFFRDNGLQKKKILGFFSMAQGTKTLHGQTMARMRAAYPKRLLDVVVPFASDVEKMGLHRAPVADFAPASVAAQAYDRLGRAVMARI
ncbi:ParA family protein [Rhodobaculum claviforme]|uniref:Cobyrinic acid a,c-diamide synthase n=1 Tax=Rhodobaculum claviforme TaxID=1549854 RepID=A0A934TLI4_9RHOB|nr:AAA family ATPase [Rhodobaculum claviforme]MBK5927671.1 cobyrinic acid a,c-diamide synthase [Rhodobaculum claviforme]